MTEPQQIPTLVRCLRCKSAYYTVTKAIKYTTLKCWKCGKLTKHKVNRSGLMVKEKGHSIIGEETFLFSERKILADKFMEWAKKNKAEVCPLNVITWMITNRKNLKTLSEKI